MIRAARWAPHVEMRKETSEAMLLLVVQHQQQEEEEWGTFAGRPTMAAWRGI